jgi:S1-C subfamily serine protease
MTATLTGRLTAAVAGTALFLAAATAEAAPHLGVKARAFPGGGVKITEVEPGSVAEDLGLEAGDVLVAINGQLVNFGSEAAAAVASSGGHVTLIVDARQGGFFQLDADLEDPTPAFFFKKAGADDQKAPEPARVKVKNLVRKKLKK